MQISPVKNEHLTAEEFEKRIGVKIVSEDEAKSMGQNEHAQAGKILTTKEAEKNFQCRIISGAEAILREQLRRRYPTATKREFERLVKAEKKEKAIKRKKAKIMKNNSKRLRQMRTALLCDLGGLVIKAGKDGQIKAEDGFTGLYDKEKIADPEHKYVPQSLGALIYLNGLIKNADGALLKKFYTLGKEAYDKGRKSK